MAKDNAVRNQKVFITLESVLKLQGMLLGAIESKKLSTDPSFNSRYSQEIRTLTYVIETLDLPIDTK